jgi:hypothetical protein
MHADSRRSTQADRTFHTKQTKGTKSILHREPRNLGSAFPRPSWNPKGIQPQSPGLRVPRRSEAKTGGTSYPGLASKNSTTPNGVAPRSQFLIALRPERRFYQDSRDGRGVFTPRQRSQRRKTSATGGRIWTLPPNLVRPAVGGVRPSRAQKCGSDRGVGIPRSRLDKRACCGRDGRTPGAVSKCPRHRFTHSE